MNDVSIDQTAVEHAYQKWARVYDTRKENGFLTKVLIRRKAKHHA